VLGWGGVYRVERSKGIVAITFGASAVKPARLWLIVPLLLVAAACSNPTPDLPPVVDVAQVFGRAPTCAGGDAGVGDAGLDAADASVGDGDPDAAVDAGPGAWVGGAKVVIISVDGLRPDAIFAAPAPHLLEQACRGGYIWQARTVLPSLTLPSHASMLSGVVPEVHGIFHDDNLSGRGVIMVPTVLSVAHEAGRRVVVVVGKAKMAQLAPVGTRDVYRWIDGTDGEVVDAALMEVAAGFDLMFVHLPGVDYVGHLRGWMSAAYLAQVRTSDEAVGRLLAGLPLTAIVILTADHGGAGYGHGSASVSDMSIPWIITGPGITAGHALLPPVQTVDTAATAAFVLGVQLPANVTGRPVAQAWSR
jgi:hypothetical protein